MEDQQTLTQLINGVEAEMRNTNYAEASIEAFLKHAALFKEFVLKTTSIDYYTEEIGAMYLKEMIDYPFSEFRPLHYKEAAYVRCINKIGDYRIHGTSIKTSKRKFDNIENWGLEDIATIESYLEKMQTADNSNATKILRMNHIRKLYQFLSSRNLHSVASISEELIHDYICFLQGYSQVYLKHMLGTLRNYFRYLYAIDYIKKDWSFSVPRVSAAKNSNIPELWDKEKIDKVLQTVDRGNPTGKRNYAIIMLVAELGLRISDISSL